MNLRGYDPDQPLTAADALARFLRALGVAGADIPPEVDERAAAYRSLLDGRRVLVVLDNASSVEQVRPLLPGTPSALVVVTSRDSLAGLVARDGARRLDLDLLPPDDAVALLDAGDDRRTAVRGVLSWSYLHLPTEAARAFRLLGLHPSSDLDPYAAAALTDTSLEQAQHFLDLLARTHLIHPASAGRYGMHDLLRAYATYLADIEDSEIDRSGALTRLFDHYLATVGAAMDTLHPHEQHRRPRVLPSATPSPPVTDPVGTSKPGLTTASATPTLPPTIPIRPATTGARLSPSTPISASPKPTTSTPT